MSDINSNCDGEQCRYPRALLKRYPLGGGGALLLCFECFQHENRYRRARGKATGCPENWPEVDWMSAELV